ncbi:MAG: hypothetical protein QM791_08225 [Ferruginibacter sp.]
MSFRNFFKNREKRKKIAHFLAGLVILIHAYEKYESGHHSWVYFTVAGIAFTLIAALHSKIEKKLPWVDGVFFLIESSLSFVVAYEYFHVGKKALPACYVALGIFQLFMAFYKSKKNMRMHKAAHS